MTSAIIVAAGSSQRMGFDKLAAELCGMSVLRHSIHAFLAADSIDAVVVVCPAERWESLDNIASEKPITRVDGGTHRQDSVEKGLAAIPHNTQWVAVHDGARPLVSPQDIDRCAQAAKDHQAATLARRATDTMKRTNPDDFVTDAVCRDHLWLMETPQTFDANLLQQAYQEVAKQGLTVTDEVSALQAIGIPTKCIESSSPNPKITTPADLRLAAALLTP